MFDFFGSMFGYDDMIDNYNDRAIDRYKVNGCIIDTAAVTDGDKLYETGIKHQHYYNGKWIIVEAYDTKEEAQKGHDKWVSIMTADTLPKQLVDCYNSKIAKEILTLGGEIISTYET